MRVAEYHRLVQQPAYVAVEAVRQAGLPVSEQRVTARMEIWQEELLDLEKYVEGEATKHGFRFRYSPAHAPQPDTTFREFLFSPRGLGLEIKGRSEKTEKPSTDDQSLAWYAAVGSTHNRLHGQFFEDHPVVYAILKIRSLAKARGTHLAGLLRWRRSDGAVHPQFNWNSPNTTRPSAENPAVQQLPERADPETAKLVKECIIPRVGAWLGPAEAWDPRKHGWVAKIDVKGAEAVIRAGCIARCRVSSPYLRTGRDIHGKTSAILSGKPEETFAKGQPDRWYRDNVGKGCYFLFIYGGEWGALQRSLWKEARIWWEKERAVRQRDTFFRAYPDLAEQYERDTTDLVRRGYIEDGYGRRWHMPLPAEFVPRQVNGRWEFSLRGSARSATLDDRVNALWHTLEYRRHCYANRRTQCDQATTTLWDIALCYHGEYVELRVPPYWENYGVPFPEAAGWTLNEGPGPGGAVLQAWIMNEVHDSKWADGAPGTLEPAMMVLFRRSMGVPADFLLEADMPRRVEAEVGPDFGHLRPYNEVAKQFGLEPMPEW